MTCPRLALPVLLVRVTVVSPSGVMSVTVQRSPFLTHPVPVARRRCCGPTCSSSGDQFFVDRYGNRVRSNAVYQAFVRARKKVGVDISFHDLRHTGQSLAASTGASLVDLKKRLGHSSTAAAQRYMHAVEGRDAQIAKALSQLALDCDATKLPKSY